MQFLSLASIISVAAYALAANPNAFSAPAENATLYAGDAFVLEWNSTGGGDSVDLILKTGTSTDLTTVLTIAKSLSNEGAVRWSVPSSVSSGQYAIEIINDDDTSSLNYSPWFEIVNNKTGSSSAIASSTSSSSSSSSSSSIITSAAIPAVTSAGSNSTLANTTANGNLSSAAITSSASGSASGSADSNSASATGSDSAADSGATGSLTATSRAGAAATDVAQWIIGAGVGVAALLI